jgi:hypothetical protein
MSQIVSNIKAETLGSAWVQLLKLILCAGELINDEIKELRNVTVSINSVSKEDPLLSGNAQQENIGEMLKVFFAEGINKFGHSYKKYIHGPRGFSDLSDVSELLLSNFDTKKAAIVLKGHNGKVPCILSVHFLVRDGQLVTSYFARGQDIYAKYYADCCAVAEMSNRLSKIIGVSCGEQIGFISSAHIYKSNIEEISQFLNRMMVVECESC